MRTVMYCENRMQAELVKGNLENMGFHPVVFDRALNVLPGIIRLSKPEVTVEVPDQEYEAALAYLNDPEAMPTTEGAEE